MVPKPEGKGKFRPPQLDTCSCVLLVTIVLSFCSSLPPSASPLFFVFIAARELSSFSLVFPCQVSFSLRGGQTSLCCFLALLLLVSVWHMFLSLGEGTEEVSAPPRWLGEAGQRERKGRKIRHAGAPQKVGTHATKYREETHTCRETVRYRYVQISMNIRS